MKNIFGSICLSCEVAAAVKDENFFRFMINSIDRFAHYDWGDIPEEDKKMNGSAVKNDGDRIVAHYNDIYIITEWDRFVTTILFVHEY